MADGRKHPKAPKPGKDLLWDSLCEYEVNAINEYLDWCKSVLGLHSWTIYVVDAPCRKGALAAVDTETLRWYAPVRVCRHWVTLPVAEQAEYLLHECLHISLDGLTEVTRSTMAYVVRRQDAYDLIVERARVEAERAVDQMAHHLVSALGGAEVLHTIRVNLDLGSDYNADEPIDFQVTTERPTLKLAATTDRPTKK